MFLLCQRIAIEKDRATFVALVRELNDLLNQKENRLVEADQNRS
jgi:hypothetical protein